MVRAPMQVQGCNFQPELLISSFHVNFDENPTQFQLELKELLLEI